MDPCRGTLQHTFSLTSFSCQLQNTLLHPDERQLSRGITSTDVAANLKVMVDLLVRESTRTEEGCVHFFSLISYIDTLQGERVSAWNTY